MQYANVDGARVAAQPKLRGHCVGCNGEMVSKCGKYVIWHWSHLSLNHCDHWWESETDWHRSWKNKFPIDWQETVLQDSITGERHIADVRTAHGVVVEFQRSTINLDEVAARETFYRPMVWVIDGSKNEFDRVNFNMMRSGVGDGGFASFQWFGRSKLFSRWHTTTPVFIDFGEQFGFWRICRFDPVTKKGVALLVSRDMFVAALVKGETDFSKNGGPASPL